ncbi:MAG: riboflavin synthase [Rhodospirillales bacterium]|nr:riboflavin synthase [Rhodospirillales bacterium]MCW8862909.1 riboflavin synthase [Rhodospirillales bacterium]MCW8969686.1 riboflavin synthase [Rhodospirillales bacterium]MCW9003461.1 riboflavin synthase [Rhodospirillales bacterium]MCW9040043.1 riboflavin synthase [Rhodospirillales bacterium]
MFTGIITDLGRVRAVEKKGDTRFEFETHYDTGTVEIGGSIACNGACMTVIEKGAGWFAISASGESLSKTTMGEWQVGTPVNFERALKVGDELGGHIVSGHVDGIARIESITPEGDSHRFVFVAPDTLKNFIAPKGSVALDGISLTVNEVNGAQFGVNVIPHTLSVTTFGQKKAGDTVNLEIDMLARYVARLLEKD